MKTFITGLVLGWLLATIGVNGLVRIGDKLTNMVTAQVTEMAK